MNYKEAWEDLKLRTDRAEKELFRMLESNEVSNTDRLRGKLSGVRLIQDYIRGYEINEE